MDENEGIASQPQEIFKNKLLLDEGKDEIAVFNALLKHLNIQDIQVEDYGGKGKLPSVIGSLPLRPNFLNIVSLGITRDADNSAMSAFTSICDSLTRNGLSAPQASGTILSGKPNIGIMIMPDGVKAGMLEDLCLAALQDESVQLYINEYIDCVKKINDPYSTNPLIESKARIHIWLSAQKKPDLRLGEAAQKGYLNWDHQAFDSLKQFLRSL
jgi:hypothetical protein